MILIAADERKIKEAAWKIKEKDGLIYVNAWESLR